MENKTQVEQKKDKVAPKNLFTRCAVTASNAPAMHGLSCDAPLIPVTLTTVNICIKLFL